MMRIPMSRAASGLLRALLARAGDASNRILLSRLRSVDWQSLTFVGERHVIELRIAGDDADRIAAGLTEGLAEAELSVPGHLVADIAVAAPREARVRRRIGARDRGADG